MELDLIGVITIVFGIVMFAVSIETMVVMYMCAVLFQSAAAIKFGDIGITPGHTLLVVLICVVIVKEKSALQLAWETIQFPRVGFSLLLLIVYCLAAGFFFPRLFQFATFINPIGATAFAPSASPIPLGPSSGNFTQSVYIGGSAVAFVTVSALLTTPARLTMIMHAMLAYAIVNIVFAGLDVACYWTGTSSLFDFIHNGNYAFHLNEAEVGFKRIAGTFSEAAAFATATLGILGFTLRLWIGGVRPKLSFALSLIEIVLLVLSTSTTAYLGLVVVVAVLYGSAVITLLSRSATPQSFYFVVIGPVIVASIVLGAALDRSLWAAVGEILQAIVFDKSQSASAAERGALNTQAITNFIDTLGLGAGTGSVRSSSFPLAVLANIGVPGALCYGALLAGIFLRPSALPRGSLPWTVQAASRAGALGILVASTISGTLIDLGLPFFILAAAACGIHPAYALLRQRVGLGSISAPQPAVETTRVEGRTTTAADDGAGFAAEAGL